LCGNSSALAHSPRILSRPSKATAVPPCRGSGIVNFIGGFATSALVYDLLRNGLVDDLHSWQTASGLGTARRLNIGALTIVLSYLACESDFLVRRGDRYRLAARYARHDSWRAVIEKFVGAYGALIRAPVGALRRTSYAHHRIDRVSLARAYTWDAESPVVLKAIARLRPKGIVDIGCGQGQLLVQACAQTGARGWGIDQSPEMCRGARKAVRTASVSDRVAIRCGSVLELRRLLSSKERAAVSVIYVGSLLNEFVLQDAHTVALLGRLTKLFPGRWLVVVDYLGTLSRDGNALAGTYTRLTDLCQALSAQGVPPATHRQWHALYHAARCRLVRVVEQEIDGLRWFAHTVQLSAAARASPPDRHA
jgi:SAM-dependent methyltransferase